MLESGANCDCAIGFQPCCFCCSVLEELLPSSNLSLLDNLLGTMLWIITLTECLWRVYAWREVRYSPCPVGNGIRVKLWRKLCIESHLWVLSLTAWSASLPLPLATCSLLTSRWGGCNVHHLSWVAFTRVCTILPVGVGRGLCCSVRPCSCVALRHSVCEKS